MKEIKVTDEQIKKLANGLCGDAKKAIENAFPEVFGQKEKMIQDVITIDFIQEVEIHLRKLQELVYATKSVDEEILRAEYVVASFLYGYVPGTKADDLQKVEERLVEKFTMR